MESYQFKSEHSTTNMKFFVVALALVAAATAAPASYDYKPAYKPTYPAYNEKYESYAPAYYDFAYRVKDDYTKGGYNYGPLDFGHNENRNGDKTTGSYDVLLPDGRRQTVNYYVDGYSGYVADVKYDGYAKTYEPAYKPAYKPAYEPAYKPTYEPAYKPAYEPAYKPAYKPAYEQAYKPAY